MQYDCNPSTETGKSAHTQGHPSLHNKFQASQEYITKPCLKKRRQKAKTEKEAKEEEKSHGDRLHQQVSASRKTALGRRVLFHSANLTCSKPFNIILNYRKYLLELSRFLSFQTNNRTVRAGHSSKLVPIL